MNAPYKQILPQAASSPRQDGALAPPLEKLRLQFYILQVVADAVLLFAGHAMAALAYVGTPWDQRTLLAAQVVLPFYLVVALYNSTYSLGSLTDWKRATLRMMVALGLSAGLFVFFAFYMKANASFSRGAVTLGLLFSGALMAGARVLVTALVKRRFGPTLTNVLVIDDGGPVFNVPHAYHVSAAEHGLSPSLSDPHGLDRLGCYMRNMDRVIVSCDLERRAEWSLVLKGSGVHGEVVSGFARELGVIGVRHYNAAGLSALIVANGPLGMRSRAAKRLLDVSCAGLGLIVLSPVLLVIALAIKLEGGGDVLFRQRRLGRGNRFFTMYKFRTMRTERADPDGRRSAARDDDRVTRVGRFLRRTSLDELPQLINVLRGQMSLVGPRPHAIGSQAGEKLFWEVDRRYWQRHSLKPGLTGLAQIRGLRGATHDEADLRLRLTADLEYLNGWSIWRDLRIILLTLRVLVHDRAF